MADSNEYVGIESAGQPTVSGSIQPAAQPLVDPGILPPVLDPQAQALPSPPVQTTKANEYVNIEQAAPLAEGQAARISMLQAQRIDTEHSVKVLGLAREMNLGSELVDRQYDQLKSAQSIESIDYAGMVSQAPALAKFISDPYRAAAVKDDLPALAKVEETVQDQSLYARAMQMLDATPSLAKLIANAPGYAADAYLAKENLKVALINRINEATGSSARIAPFKTPAVLHDNLVGNALEAGITQVESQVAHAPGYAVDLYMAGRNLKLSAFDAITGNQTPRVRTPRLFHDNPLTQYSDTQLEKAQALSPEASQSTVKLMAEGDYAKAGRTAFYSLVTNAPNLAIMMTLGRLHMAAEAAAWAAATTGAGAAGENAARIREEQDREGIPPALREPEAFAQEKLNPDVATGGAFVKGAAEALFEHVGTYLPLKAWEDAVFNMGGKAAIRETVKDFSKTMLRTVFSNAAEESLTQGAQDLTDYYTGVNPDALKGIGLRMADAGVIGGLTGGALVAPAGAASGFARRAMHAQQTAQANAAATFITDLARTTGETKTAGRDPGTAKEILSGTVEGSESQDVLVDPNAIEKYFQSKGENPTAVMQKLGVLPEFGAAKETGTNLKIPLATFVTELVQKGHPDLVNDAKFSDEALTVNEAREVDRETAVAAHEADAQATLDAGPLNAKGLTAEQQFEESMQTVREEVASQLEAAGQSPEHAQIMQRILETSARRLGRDPLELYREINLRIRGAGAEINQPAPGTRTLNQNESATWRMPTDEEVAADLNGEQDFFTNVQDYDLPDVDAKLLQDLIKARGRVQTFTPQEARAQLSGFEPLSRADVVSGKGGYLPSSDRITQGLDAGEKLPMVIATEEPGGGYTVISGRHRIGHVTERGLPVQAVIIPYPQRGVDYAKEVRDRESSRSRSELAAQFAQGTLRDTSASSLTNAGDESNQQAVVAQPLVDRSGFSLERLANLLEGNAVPMQKGGLGETVPLFSVLSNMHAAVLNDPQIADAIVGAVPVDVVNHLFGSESAAKVALHNEAMLQDSAAFDAELAVTGTGDASGPVGLLMREAARVTAQFVEAARSTRGEAVKGATAPIAGEDGTRTLAQDDSDIRNAFIEVGPTGLNIQLLANANFSSFLHESGHFIVELMKRYSSAEGAPAQIKQDFDTLMKHVGNDGGAITVAQHEELARSFEAYLMEGKAPSKDLRRAFTRIKTWMVDVYRHITGLNVNLTDDVRGVFDRILATDEEIADAQKMQGMDPLFAEPAKYGMTPDQIAEYQSAVDSARLAADDELRVKVMTDVEKKETAFYREQHAQITDEVTAEVNALPVYQALLALQTGKTVGGEKVESLGFGRFKLDRAAVVAEYGEEVAKAMPRATMSREGGLHPDIVAQVFGFEHGGNLIEAMRAAEDRRAVIERAVEARMNALDPDLFQSEKMADAAMDAIHNDQRAKVIKIEMKHLLAENPGVVRKVTERATKRMPTDQAIRDQVTRILAAKTVQEMTPNQYRIAERKAAAEAGKALARGDLDAVFEAKRRELINHELYRGAVEARTAVEKDLRFFRKLGATDEKVSKTRDTNLVNAARAILAAFGIGEEGKQPAEYLAALKAYDPEAYNAAAFHVQAATENGSGFYKGQTYDDFVAMSDAVKALWDLSKSTKEIEIEGRKLQTEAAKGELIGQLQAIAPEQKAEYTRSQTKWEKANGYVRGYKADMTRVEGAMQALDVKGIGPFTRYIFRPVSEAVTRYRVEKTEKLRALESLFRQYQHIFSPKKIVATELGPNGHLFDDKTQLLMALAHSGNESNLKKLLVGRDWGSVSEDGTLDRSKWDAFIARMQANGTLTKADYDFVQGVWDLNETMKAGAQRAHKATQGYYFNEITASPVMTPFGEYRGGYIPAKLDLEMSETAKIRAEKESFEQGNNSYQFPTTGRGFTKSRVEQFAGPLSLNMNLLSNHLDQVLRFTHIEPVVKSVARVVTDDEFREVMKTVDASMASDTLVPWLQRSATQKIVMPSQTGIGRATDKMAAYLRRGISGNILVGNLTNGLQQLTGYQVAMAKVGAGHIGEAMVTYYRNPKKTVAAIYEMSPWMATTQESTIIEITNEMEQILTDPTIFQSVDKFTQRHGQFLQSGFQNMVNPVVWLGAYNQALAAGESHQDAVFLGDSAVRTTQGTQNAEDISRYETGTQTERLFKYFASYFNMIWNLNQSEIQKISRDVGLKKGAGRAFYLYMTAIALPAVTAELITQGMGGHIGPEDDEGWAYYALKTYFGSQFRLATAVVPYVGQVASAAYGQFTKEQYDDRLSISPVISALEGSVGVPVELYKRLVKKVHNERKLTRDVLGMVGLLTQLPVQPLAKPINYLRDVQDGRIRPTGPIDFARGVITGKGERR